MEQESIFDIFKEEAYELLLKWEALLLEDEALNNTASMREILRVAHTLKGSSKTAGFSEFGSFVHEIEDYLNYCQTNQIIGSESMINILLETHSGLLHWLHEGNAEQKHLKLIREKIKQETAQTPSKSVQSSEQPAKRIPLSINKKPLTRRDLSKQAAPAKTTKKESTRNSSAATLNQVIRVQKDRIDQLIQLIGELSTQLTIVNSEQRSRNNYSDVERTAMQYAMKYLQNIGELALSMSLQPIVQLFQRLERACKDVANISQKQIKINKIGADTEIDKTVIERITEPMIHLVRNCVDHGIEDSAIRVQNKKDPVGQITLKAEQNSGNVLITISDDGGGIDPKRIRKAAIEKKVISEDQVLTDQEAIRLIFEPQFSTKDAVSEVSGRGVGMDIVSTTLIELGGSIEVFSEIGKGTRFEINLPTNISLIESLIIENNQDYYVIPLRDCAEVIDLNEVTIEHQEDGCATFVWKDEIVSLHKLDDFFVLDHRAKESDQKIAVINRFEGHPFAFCFDAMVGRESLFIKPLKGEFGDMFGVSGTTILPNGKASVMINVNEVAKNFHSKFKGSSS